MVLSTRNNECSCKLLSEAEKKEAGLDVRSFMNRMKKRINKVRGTEEENNTFLLRYNYEAYARSQA